VEELTDIYVKKSYPRMNRRTRKAKELARMEHISADAQTIKYADIIDNCREIVTDDSDFAAVFLRECATLLDKVNQGNPQLYAQAQETVRRAFEELAD
jgi:guanosine-3',5'-bis(diphosphate) 3'-pyrophosphohydrolase